MTKTYKNLHDIFMHLLKFPFIKALEKSRQLIYKFALLHFYGTDYAVMPPLQSPDRKSRTVQMSNSIQEFLEKTLMVISDIQVTMTDSSLKNRCLMNAP